MRALKSRIEQLEAAMPSNTAVPEAVVRYNPGDARDWLPGIIADLGWPASQHALIIIDASGPIGAAPEVVVPPVLDHQATAQQASALAHAGRGPGPWFIAVAGRGWADAVPMPDGIEALTADLRRQRLRADVGTDGEL